MANCLYTQQELIDKLKDLNEKMDEAETQSSLDTGQSDHEYRNSVRTWREQYEKYLAMFQNCYPAAYRSYFGKSVINFRSSKCRN